MDEPAPISPAFPAVVGVTSLLVLVQAVLAGKFIDGRGGQGLINAHAGVAYAICLTSLVAAVVAFLSLRVRAPELWWGSLALFVLVVAQTAIGRTITDGGHDGLITLHVPLAMIIFGISVWLPVRSTALRRA